METTTKSRSEEQVEAQLESIREMVKELEAARDDDDKREAAETTIHEDVLEVQIRSRWYSPGAAKQDTRPAEYTILLCTGGPAVLPGHGSPAGWQVTPPRHWPAAQCSWPYPGAKTMDHDTNGTDDQHDDRNLTAAEGRHEHDADRCDDQRRSAVTTKGR